MANNAERWKITWRNARWFWPSTAAPPQLTKINHLVGSQYIEEWNYDPGEVGYVNWCIPDNWDGNLIWVKVYWENQDFDQEDSLCSWGLAFYTFADGDNLTNFGSPYYLLDTFRSRWDLNVSGEIGIDTSQTSYFAPQPGDYTTLFISRKNTDEYGTNPNWIGVRIRYGVQ